VLLLLGSFLAAHITEPRFFVPALMLQLFAVVQLALHIHKLVVLRSLDYSEPVVSIQKRLAALRVRSLRQLVWLYACLPLLWPPLLIVVMQGLLGLDAYVLFGLPYLAVNLLVGLACVPLVLWLARIASGSSPSG
jgi:serine/threonine-protein kinase